MSFFYFVEILNHNGDVQTRYKFTELPISLGRSYRNDIILDDHHVAAEHALIEMGESGMLTLRDLGSQNGIKIKGKRHSQLHINGDTVVHLGQTQIRVRDSDYAVSAEVSVSTHQHWQGWPLLAVSILILCALSLSEAWINDINENKASDYIMGIFPWLISGAVWAGIWALANRVFGGTANFNRHLFTLCCGLLAAQISEIIYTILGFSFSWEAPLLYKVHIAIAIATTTIYYHLRLINTRRRKLIKILCISAALTISGLRLLNNYQTTNKVADELYMSEILPPAMRVSPNHSLAEFDQSIQDLKTEIDAERDKALKEKAEKKSSQKP
ncbi:hypothetical protein GCM10011613_22070 [Cellvibrio zantedeschiae]|uniref:FHA domain-containing protein n=1 Tax=Cellvibrio zantedeschiae TaxID=1237077 RepID=A0ABQ3B5Y9_9GAMM|nr:FHA domain-containing protein [Cellvibrio zantedeschiae]GGY77142.1 hypothetical protein GCM10011613_22070 [Cellvibrio zantedeschiae]